MTAALTIGFIGSGRMATALAPMPASRVPAWPILLFAAGSLHYNYTLFGPRSVEEFVLLQLAILVLSAWLLFRRSVQPARRAWGG